MTCNVAFITDSGYVYSTKVAVRSVLKTTPSASVHIVTSEVSGSDITELASLSERVKVVELSDADVAWSKGFSLHSSPHMSNACYLKAILADVLPMDRVLYMDSDCIAVRDVSELYDSDMKEHHLIAATFNSQIREVHRNRLRLVGDYFNAGVLVMPLKKWREIGMRSMFESWYRDNIDRVFMDDQDVFNCITDTRVKWIKKHWNVTQRELFNPSSNFDIPRDKVGIIHFNGPEKPWFPNYRSMFNSFYFDFDSAEGVVADYLDKDL